MQLWIWRNFGVRLPSDWELLQFTREESAGRCAFADRHQFRLELDWRVVPAPPDFERMLSDYRSRLVELGMKRVQNVSRKGWLGVTCEGPEGVTTRFGRHFPGESCLLELVFIWRNGRNLEEEATVLDSVTEEPVHEGCLRRWRAFGMDLLVTSGLALDRCVVEPAHAQMVFSKPGGGVMESFARHGMVTDWLTGSIEDWLMNRAPRSVSAARAGSSHVEGHSIAKVCGSQRAAGVDGIMGRRMHYESEAWKCPVDGRLYSVSRTHNDGKQSACVPLAGTRLSCCDGLRLLGGRV